MHLQKHRTVVISEGIPWLCLVKGEVPEDPRIDAANYVNRAPIPAFHFLRFLTAKKRIF